MTRVALVAFLVALLPAIAWAQDQDKAPPGDAAHGKKIFTQDVCYSCHGYVGQGSRNTGPRIARTALPFSAFQQQIRQPAAEMPAYTPKVLSDKDVADIFAYLQSLPVPADAKDIAILQY